MKLSNKLLKISKRKAIKTNLLLELNQMIQTL